MGHLFCGSLDGKNQGRSGSKAEGKSLRDGKSGLQREATCGDGGLHQLSDLCGRLSGGGRLPERGPFGRISDERPERDPEKQVWFVEKASKKERPFQGELGPFQQHGVSLHPLRKLSGSVPGGDSPQRAVAFPSAGPGSLELLSQKDRDDPGQPRGEP